ncbi:hypothetical protein FIU86_11275 [Roseovarius sp. THAF9]|nr:hypothetical protein FIU86_11275 [Roseovarius sp. THAF9]
MSRRTEARLWDNGVSKEEETVMYTHILVPVSFDEERDAKGAMRVAEVLAEHSAKITLFHVIEQIPSYAATYLPGDYVKERKIAVQAELDSAAEGLENASGVVVDGHSGRTIVDYADSHKVDCIVIAGHRPGMGDLLLGSTAQYVVRHAACAVHVLR